MTIKNEELFSLIGEIDDQWLTEAEKAILGDKNFVRLVKLGLFAAAASFAFVAAVWMFYGRKTIGTHKY